MGTSAHRITAPLRDGGRRWLLPLSRPARARASADGPADVRRDFERLLDQAHNRLDSHDFAQVLLAVQRAVAPLGRGRPPGRPDGASRVPSSGISPAARAALRPIHALLYLTVRHSDPLSSASDFATVGRRIDDYVEELAARPKGCALAFE
ncbi:MAG TPA: hypothetical protein VKD47_08510 [Miltoncostaeaceae bacterium]|nr:hypothetical protein [Miltoncostaeaceae bacterium]